MLGRVAAGLGVAAIGLVWLIAWIPMVLYCSGAFVLNALRGGARRLAG